MNKIMILHSAVGAFRTDTIELSGWRPRRDLNPCYRRERAFEGSWMDLARFLRMATRDSILV